MKRPLDRAATSAKKRRLHTPAIIDGIEGPILAWLTECCDDRFRALALTSWQWLQHAVPLRGAYLCTIIRQNHKTMNITNRTYTWLSVRIDLDNHSASNDTRVRTTSTYALAPNTSIQHIVTVSPQGHEITLSVAFREGAAFWCTATIEFLRYGPDNARLTLDCSSSGRFTRTLVTNGHTRVD